MSDIGQSVYQNRCTSASSISGRECPTYQKTGRPYPWLVCRLNFNCNSQIANCKVSYYLPSAGLKLNFWPPMEASNIRPPLGFTKTATPFSNRAAAEAPDLSATADALAANSSLLFLNLFSASSFSKTITSE